MIVSPASVSEETCRRPSRRWTSWVFDDVRALTAIFVFECLILSVLQLPTSLSLRWFIDSDLGSNLTVQKLLDRGLQPMVDFGYIYGLAPLVLGRLWFRVFGLCPAAYTAAMTVIRIIIAWGMARCASSLKVGPAGVALMIIGMPLAAQPTYLNFAHAVEAALICHALADQASGRKPRALALTTASLFMKPAMAYVYGLLQVILIVRSGRGLGVRSILRALLPAALTGLVMASILAAWFGPMVVARSLLPVSGAEVYRLHHYGFFLGKGRVFWLPENPSLRYYLLGPAGHYVAGLLVLAVASAVAIRRLKRLRIGQSDPVAEVVVCGGVMQIVFVAVMYADWASYQYYYNVLIIGMAGVAAMGRRASLMVGALALAMVLGYKWPINNEIRAWKSGSLSSETAGLWCSEDDRRELLQIRALLDDQPASFLTAGGGCFEIIVPGFAPAENWFLVAGIPTAVELGRKLAQIDQSSAIVIPLGPRKAEAFFDEWPGGRSKMNEFYEIGKFKNYQVFKRRKPPQVSPSPVKKNEHAAVPNA